MRVLVVADNMLARTGLAALLSTQETLVVVGQVAGGERLAEDIEVYRPEVVIYDLGYDPAATLPVLEEISDLPVVVLLPEPSYAVSTITALGEGAIYGLMLRDSHPDSLAAALHAAYAGVVSLDPLIAAALIVPEADLSEPLADDLTPREAEVLQLLAEGLPNKQIAQQLGISPNTVKFHINAILSKLDVQSRTEAVVRATRLGLIIL
jgi:two-component system, NarL family, nitrate/nitrite response regulator NarL